MSQEGKEQKCTQNGMTKKQRQFSGLSYSFSGKKDKQLERGHQNNPKKHIKTKVESIIKQSQQTQESDQNRLTATTLTPASKESDNPFAMINKMFQAGNGEGGSAAQSQIQTHALIKYILDRNKKNVVTHHINIVNKDTQLYSDKYARLNRSANSQKVHKDAKVTEILEQTEFQEVEKSHTTPDEFRKHKLGIKTPTKSSKCGQQLNYIYRKIKEEVRGIKQLNSSSNLNKKVKREIQQCSKARVQDTDMAMEGEEQIMGPSKKVSKILFNSVNPDDKDRLDSHNRKAVSVAGLASYKFRSVKAGRNLGLRVCSSEAQILQEKIKSVQKRVKCSQERSKSIQYRTAHDKQRKIKQLLFQESIIRSEKKSQSLNKYLNSLQRHKTKISMIYGEENDRLNSINELMKKQSLKRDLAAFAVDEIKHKVEEQFEETDADETLLQNNGSPVLRSQLSEYRRMEINDERQLSRRKLVQRRPQRPQHKKILVASRKKRDFLDVKQGRTRPGQIQEKRSSVILVNSLTFIKD